MITSSPGSTVARIAAASASVAPLVTQILLGDQAQAPDAGHNAPRPPRAAPAARATAHIGSILPSAPRAAASRISSRPAEIRKPLPQIDRAMLGGGKRHALEHAGRHLLVERVQCRTPLFRIAAISPAP